MLGRSTALNRVDCCGQQGFKSIENFIKCMEKAPDRIHKPQKITKSDLVFWEVVNCCRTATSAPTDCSNFATKKFVQLMPSFSFEFYRKMLFSENHW